MRPLGHLCKTGTARGILALAGIVMLSGCERHSEAEARALLAGWVDLGETLYFQSQRECTAAVFRVKSADIKSRVPVYDSAEAAVYSGGKQRPFAITAKGKSADQVFIDLMNADRPTGVAVQSVGLVAKPCMSNKASNTFYAALKADPSTVIFSYEDAAFAVLNPVRGVVVLTSGDV